MIRVLVASNSPASRGRITGMLRHAGAGSVGARVDVIAAVGVGHPTVIAARERSFDVAIIDGRTCISEALASVRALSSGTRVLVLTADGDTDMMLRAVRAGAVGHLDAGLTDPTELVRAIQSVHRGGSYISPRVAPVMLDVIRSVSLTIDLSDREHDLTEREAEVMSLIAAGLSNVAIAGRLFISGKTVKNHINRAYAKLEANNRQEAISLWRGIPIAA